MAAAVTVAVMRHFDLVVIGSGSGNSILIDELSGRSTAIVEESTFGGTCLNVGCIPTKMYVYAADVANTVGVAGRYGLDASLNAVHWAEIRNRVFGRIDPISAGGRNYRRDSDTVTLFEGHAEFTGPRRLRITTGPSAGEEITADDVVVATGSRAKVPPVVANSGVTFHTSDTVMRMADLPARIVIVGGGYVAAEFAHIFSALGTEVTLTVRGPQLLGQLDEEIGRRFNKLAAMHWDVRLDTEIRAVSAAGSGVELTISDGSTLAADTLLVATGRTPNSDRLGLASAGVETDDFERVVVDEYQRTTAPGVWALGDVSSPAQLKHVANQDARVVAHNLAHPSQLQRSNHTAIPYAVFTDPQLASVGLTEQQARARGLRYVSATQAFGGTAFGWAMEDTTGACKVLADPDTGCLLGAHLMGPYASTLIQPLIQAMAFGQHVHDVARNQYWIHPALSEVVENALLRLDVGHRPDPPF
jgi:mycothione reductase